MSYELITDNCKGGENKNSVEYLCFQNNGNIGYTSIVHISVYCMSKNEGDFFFEVGNSPPPIFSDL